MGAVAYTCSRCGAPLEVTPEAIVAICSYCGYPNIIHGVIDSEDVRIVPPADRTRAEEAFWAHVDADFDLRRIKRGISVTEVYGVYVPVWVGRVRLRGRISYYKTKSTDKGTERVYRVENIDTEELVPFVARRQVATFGVKELIASIDEKTLSTARRLVDIAEHEWPSLKLDEILNTEYDRREAVERIWEDSLDMLREAYAAKGHIDGFDVTAEKPRDVALYLLPLWHVYYKYEHSNYVAVLSGWNLRLLVKTEPVTVVRRLVYTIATLLSIVASGAVSYIVFTSKKVSGSAVAFSLLLLAACYYLSKLIVRDIRVEEGG